MLASHPEHVAPATADRLPLEWHQATVKRLQEKLEERGLDGILITDRWNIIYFTGLFHTTTERPFSCFIPTKDLEVHWFYPGLDLELVRSWWFTDGDYYYDFPHAEGSYPDQGIVTTGPAVDLLKWQLDGIAETWFWGQEDRTKPAAHSRNDETHEADSAGRHLCRRKRYLRQDETR